MAGVTNYGGCCYGITMVRVCYPQNAAPVTQAGTAMSTALLSLPFPSRITDQVKTKCKRSFSSTTLLLDQFNALAPFSPFPFQLKIRPNTLRGSAYVSAPAAEPITGDGDPKFDHLNSPNIQSQLAIGWGLLWSLLVRHKLRLALSVFALVGCTTCTLSMPIYSGFVIREDDWEC